MDGPPDPTSTDPIAAAWQEVDRAWADEDAHRRFIALCLSLDRLADAGTRYRQVRDTDPPRRAEAERRIDAVLAAATERMQLDRSEPSPNLGRGVRLLAVVVGVGMMALAGWLWLRAG